MLPKRRRLNASDVRRVLSVGRSLRSGVLAAKFASGPEALRVAAVVSKKVARSAVARNRLRRALYQALSPLSGHGDLVVFVQKVPTPPLSRAFATDIFEITKKIFPPTH